MKTLTGMGGLGNAQELAELLRQMGRGPDSMLAHITPEEAQMLLESGGSGRMNPMTGLPEFQPEPDPASFEDYIYNQPQQPLDPSSFEDYIYNQPQPQYTYDVEAQPGGFYGTNVTLNGHWVWPRTVSTCYATNSRIRIKSYPWCAWHGTLSVSTIHC